LKQKIKKAKKIVKTIEKSADQSSKNEIFTSKLAEQQGELTSTMYKLCHEESQKTLKLTEATEHLGNNSDQKVQT